MGLGDSLCVRIINVINNPTMIVFRKKYMLLLSLIKYSIFFFQLNLIASVKLGNPFAQIQMRKHEFSDDLSTN